MSVVDRVWHLLLLWQFLWMSDDYVQWGYALNWHVFLIVKVFQMCAHSTRKWKVLCWNVRGLNSDKHQRALRSKIEESQCSIICIEETKYEYIDHKLIRKFCPKRFDNFVYSPSVGAFGGILIIWNSSIFSGSLIEIQNYGIIMNFVSTHNGESWNLVSVYGPCQGELRDIFASWLYNLQIAVGSNWLLLGDFNFIRSQDNRNKPGGMFMICFFSTTSFDTLVFLSSL
jgi:hypothetical protein